MSVPKDLKLSEVLEVVRSNQAIIFVADLCLALKISRQTLYNYFPAGTEGLAEITDALGHNRTALKIALRQKWYNSDNPTTQIALYKLASDDEERKALSGQWVDASITAEKTIELKID